MSESSARYVARPHPDIIEIVPDYLKKRKNEMNQLFEFLLKKDYSSIKKIAHKMRGNGSSYGFVELSEYATELEKAAKQQHQEKVRKWLEKCQFYLENVVVEFET